MTKFTNLSDRSKIGFLSCGIVLVFGNVAWRITHADDAAASAPPAVETLAPTASVPPAATAATGAPADQPSGAILVSNEAATPTADIFRRVIPKDAQSSHPAPPTSPPSVALVSSGSAAQPLAPMPMPALSGSLSAEPMPAINQPAVAPAHSEPPLRLSGVVGGDAPLAVIQLDGKSQVVHIGQTFGAGYRLLTINGREAKVRVGEETVVLKVGEK